MNMQNVIIVIILALILIPAVKGMITHMKGEGSCCGGPKEKAPHKKIAGKVQSRLIVGIEGMHCDNCKNRVEKHLDELDGVVAKVSLARKQADVRLYSEVPQELIRKTIEDLDFTVTSIEKR